MAIRSNKHSKSIAGILPEKKKIKETLLDSSPNRKCTFFFMSKKIVHRSRKEKIGTLALHKIIFKKVAISLLEVPVYHT